LLGAAQLLHSFLATRSRRRPQVHASFVEVARVASPDLNAGAVLMSRTIVALAIVAFGAGGITLPAPDDGGMLVTARWLSQHLRDPNLVVLQTGEEGNYRKEHIAGARFITLNDIGLMEAPGLEMPPADSLRHQLERFGISDNSRVVVAFADGSATGATRVIFTLYYAGLGDRTSLLDGGLPEWKRQGFATTSAAPARSRGHFTHATNPSLIVTAADIQARANGPRRRLVDARDPQYYSGTPASGMSGMGMAPGHIAGAVNLPFNTMLDDSSRVLDRPALASLFAKAGVAPGDTVVAYCHIGMQATLVLFAARLLGHPTLLYDGSFHDWSNRKLPTEGGQ
jgi:thiosulfate/3-mercaptopyruvate sulfurtransferase